MGFRFRRSIKIAKGFRLNVSGSGLSLSVGGRGATMNFSSRGTRATIGIPGTGISWSGKVSSAPSPARAAAQSARREIQAARAAARAATNAAREAAAFEKALRQREAVEAEERDEQAVESLVDWWRTLALPAPPMDEYRAALQPRSLDEQALPPTPSKTHGTKHPTPSIDLDTFRAAHLATIEESLRPRRFQAISSLHMVIAAVAGAGATALVGLATAVSRNVALTLAGAVGILLMLVVNAIGSHLERRARRRALQTEFSHSWPGVEEAAKRKHAERCEEIENDFIARATEAEALHRAALAEHTRVVATLREQWERSEAARIELLTRLVAGDAEECTRVLASSLESIEFPFEADVDFSISDDGHTVQLLVDLPEIEDCIPETRIKALKNGTTKTTKRTRAERFGLYARLVVGLGVALGTHVHCILPAARTVTVAAYTQRRARGKGVIEDQFIYEMTIPRDDAEDMDPTRTAALDMFQMMDCRVDFDASGNFRKLAAPSWAPDVRPIECSS
jgi:hypothetical protein